MILPIFNPLELLLLQKIDKQFEVEYPEPLSNPDQFREEQYV